MTVTPKDLMQAFLDSGMSIDPDNFDKDLPLSEQGIDSLDMAHVLLHIEETYGLRIEDDELEQLRSFNNYLEYLTTRLSGRQG